MKEMRKSRGHTSMPAFFLFFLFFINLPLKQRNEQDVVIQFPLATVALSCTIELGVCCFQSFLETS